MELLALQRRRSNCDVLLMTFFVSREEECNWGMLLGQTTVISESKTGFKLLSIASNILRKVAFGETPLGKSAHDSASIQRETEHPWMKVRISCKSS